MPFLWLNSRPRAYVKTRTEGKFPPVWYIFFLSATDYTLIVWRHEQRGWSYGFVSTSWYSHLIHCLPLFCKVEHWISKETCFPSLLSDSDGTRVFNPRSWTLKVDFPFCHIMGDCSSNPLHIQFSFLLWDTILQAVHYCLRLGLFRGQPYTRNWAHGINVGGNFRQDSQESGEQKHSQMGVSVGTRETGLCTYRSWTRSKWSLLDTVPGTRVGEDEHTDSLAYFLCNTFQFFPASIWVTATSRDLFPFSSKLLCSPACVTFS